MLFCYGVAFFLISIVVRTLPIGIVYAIWSAGGIVLVSLIAYFVYQQSLDFPALIGIGLIISGVVVINLFSKSSVH